MQDTRVQSLGWEDPLEKEMAAHSSILAWKIPWMAEPGRLLSMRLQRVGHDWATSLTHSLTKAIRYWLNHNKFVQDPIKNYLHLSNYFLFFFFFKYLFIWLCQVLIAAHGIFDLCCKVWSLNCSMWDLIPWPGMEPGPLHCQHGVLATGSSGKYLKQTFWTTPVLQLKKGGDQVHHDPWDFVASTFSPQRWAITFLNSQKAERIRTEGDVH